MVFFLRFWHHLSSVFREREARVVAIFFALLAFSLFLGDGKQHLIDLFGSVGVLFLLYSRFGQGVRARSLPKGILLGWAVLLIYHTVQVLWSDDAGYTLAATVRMIHAFLFSFLFFTIADKKTVALFCNGVIALSFLAVAAAFIFGLFPALSTILPSMNLLLFSYGHNHLADLLVFSFPVAIYAAFVQNKPLVRYICAVFVVALVATVARGAWLMVSLFLLFFAYRQAKSQKRRFMLLLSGAIVFLFIGFSFLPQRLNLMNRQNNVFYAKFIKPTIITDSRLAYWRQAVRAIAERPMFGSGAGTFLLQSKRLQERQSSFSWFAHSFPLQAVVELGVVGSVVLFFLLWSYYRATQTGRLLSGEETALASAAILLFAYSMIEFALDYWILWSLFWATTGLLAGLVWRSRTNKNVHVQTQVIGWSIAFLSLYYVFTVSGEVAKLTGSARVATFFAPHNQETALFYLMRPQEDRVPEDVLVQMIEFFHRRNPKVLFEIAKREGKQNEDDVKKFYQQTLRLDPQNLEYRDEYIDFLFSLNDSASINDMVRIVSLFLLPPSSRPTAELLLTSRSKALEAAYSPELFEKIRDERGGRLYVSKLYYLLGLSTFAHDPLLTKELWTIARDAYPKLGVLHAELASVWLYALNNREEAERVVFLCRQHPEPALHCSKLSNSLANLTLPGQLSGAVLAHGE